MSGEASSGRSSLPSAAATNRPTCPGTGNTRLKNSFCGAGLAIAPTATSITNTAFIVSCFPERAQPSVPSAAHGSLHDARYHDPSALSTAKITKHTKHTKKDDGLNAENRKARRSSACETFHRGRLCCGAVGAIAAREPGRSHARSFRVLRGLRVLRGYVPRSASSALSAVKTWPRGPQLQRDAVHAGM